MEQLHDHNQRTYENICRMYNEGIQRVAVVQPTGSGKSLLMAKLIEDNPNSRFFVLSTRHEINDQFKEKLDEGMLERSDFNIYCNMPNMKQEVMELLQPDYILLDEMHRALAKEWSKGIKVLLEMYPNAKVLGLSATPIRYLDRCRNVAEELFNGNLACDMSLSQAILDGILPMARYVCGVYSYEKDAESLNRKIEKSCNSDEEKKELLKELKILKENLDKGHGVADIFRKYIMTGNEKLVVFLKDTTHLRIMKPVIEKWFLDAGFSVRLYEVHSKNSDKDKEFQAFKEDQEDGIVKACLSVNMVVEGIHGDIDGVIMLRNTISANMYFQMIGRAFACGKKTIPLIIDLVANSQFISDAVDNFPNELRGEIEKRKKECEKEGKEYEVGFDVDEFIVMDEFMDVVSGFRAIEGRLQGDWENGLKHFDKYVREHDGDVLVPTSYRDEDGFFIGKWVSHRRAEFKKDMLDKDRIMELNKHGFVWDVKKFNFENNVKAVVNYYEKYGKYPSQHSEDLTIKRLGEFAVNERIKMKNGNYGEWKREIIKNYLPEYFCKNRSEVSFDMFLHYLKLYKEKYGHANVKEKDVIEGYKIGKKYSEINELYKNGKLPTDRIEVLEEHGLYFGDKTDKMFYQRIDLVKEAVMNNVIISNKNQIYRKINLYYWIKSTVKRRYKNNQLKLEEKKNIESILGKTLEEFFGNKLKEKAKYTKIVDIVEEKEIAICESAYQAAKFIQNKYSIKANFTSILHRLNGKAAFPYKARFMFYYATDEEVRKYLEDSKQYNL